MKTLIKPGDNLGGLLKMWALPQSDISITGKTVNFVTTENIFEMYCRPDSMAQTETKEQTSGGIVYSTEIIGFAPCETQEMEDAINYLEPRKLALITKNGNGLYRLFGSQNYPIRLRGVMTSGADTSSAAGYELRFDGKSTSRSVIIDNPF
jgi:hypothetical protein